MSIRILQIVTQMERGGIETMLMNYYRQMDREQVQFDFLVHRLERKFYDDEIETLGGRIYRMPRLNPFNPGYYRALSRFFSQHPEYRVVHAHLDCLSAIPLGVAKRCGVRVRIAHSHNTNEIHNIKYPIKRICKKFIPFTATRLFAASELAGRWMFGRRKFTLLHNAVDTMRYRWNPQVREEVRRELGIAEDRLVVGLVGRFMPQKNHAFLLEVMANLVKKHPDALLLLVGTGELEKELKVKVERMGLHRNVLFTGSRSDVERVLQAMDVFVMTSLFEGFPVVLVEAQAAGLPCVISANITSESLLVPGRVIRLKLEDPVEEWSESILRVADYPRYDTRRDMIKSGYDICENAARLAAYYKRCYGTTPEQEGQDEHSI